MSSKFSRYAGLSGLEGVAGTIVNNNGTYQIQTASGQLYNWNNPIKNIAPGEQVTVAEGELSPASAGAGSSASGGSSVPAGAVAGSGIPAYSGTLTPYDSSLLSELQSVNPFYSYLNQYYPNWESELNVARQPNAFSAFRTGIGSPLSLFNNYPWEKNWGQALNGIGDFSGSPIRLGPGPEIKPRPPVRLGPGPEIRPGGHTWGLSGIEDDMKGFYAEHSNAIKIGAALLGAAVLFKWLPGKRR